MIQQFLGLAENPCVNIKQCCLCPLCGEINEKKGTLNALKCKKCAKDFCYICSKPIKPETHYQGTSQCYENSEPYFDF